MQKPFNTLPNCAAAVTRAGLLSIVAALAACAPDWPDTGFAPSSAAEAAPDAQLLTGPELSGVLSTGSDPTALETAADLDQRATALRSRGTALSRPVIDPGTRTSLQTAADCAASGDAIRSPTTNELCIDR